MRYLVIAITCLSCLSFICPEKKARKILISGTVTQTHAYCGGARPNEDILADLGTPRPFGNKKIYIKKGEVNTFESKVLIALTSDDNGNFRIKLQPGKYIIVDSTKKDLTYYNTLLRTYRIQTASYQAIDTICLKEWYIKPDCNFEVSETGLKNIKVNFQKPCSEYIPCCRFRGPFRE